MTHWEDHMSTTRESIQYWNWNITYTTFQETEYGCSRPNYKCSLEWTQLFSHTAGQIYWIFDDQIFNIKESVSEICQMVFTDFENLFNSLVTCQKMIPMLFLQASRRIHVFNRLGLIFPAYTSFDSSWYFTLHCGTRTPSRTHGTNNNRSTDRLRSPQ